MKLKNIDRIPKPFHKDIHKFVGICKNKLKDDLVSIILFGSIARKKQNKWSDLDFCVVSKKASDKERFSIMKKFSRNCDLVLRKEEDIASYLHNLSSLDLNIFSEGITIYGKDVLKKNRMTFEQIKRKYHLIRKTSLGKGVWEIGTAS